MTTFADYLVKFGVTLGMGPNRGLFVSRAVSVGAEVIYSTPITFRNSEDDSCESCLSDQSAEKLLRCGGCKYVQYCSRECQKRHWKVHKTECTYFANHKPEFPRTSDILLCVRFFLQRSLSPPLSAVFESLPSNESSILQYSDSIQPNALISYNYLCSSGLPVTLAEVTTYMCRAECNNFSIWGEDLFVVGAGVYPVGALLNHHCQPNCFIYYDLSTMRQSVRALRNIAVGEELCHSYVDMCIPRSVRRDMLGMGYAFTCDCSRCQSDDISGLEDLSALSKSVRDLTDLKRFGEAANAAKKTLSIYEQVYRGPHPNLGLHLDLLGQLCVRAGDDAEGIRFLEQAYEMMKLLYGTESPLVNAMQDTLQSLR